MAGVYFNPGNITWSSILYYDATVIGLPGPDCNTARFNVDLTGAGVDMPPLSALS